MPPILNWVIYVLLIILVVYVILQLVGAIS